MARRFWRWPETRRLPSLPLLQTHPNPGLACPYARTHAHHGPGTIALSGHLIEALDALCMARIPATWLKASWEAATLGGWFTGLLQVGRGGRSDRAGLRQACLLQQRHDGWQRAGVDGGQAGALLRRSESSGHRASRLPPAHPPPPMLARCRPPQRHDQLVKWLTAGRPRAYWLTGFFNPQGLLTAMKQEVNRRHAPDKWALDDVVMTSEVGGGGRGRGLAKRCGARGAASQGPCVAAGWSGCGERDGRQGRRRAVV